MAIACVSTLLALTGCGDDDGHTHEDAGPRADSGDDPDSGPTGMDAGPDVDGGPDVIPDEYVFESRFNAGESSVGHAGQTTRQILIQDLVGEIEAISAGVLGGTLDATLVDEEGEVTARLNAFVRAGSSDLGTRALPSLVAEGDMLCESTYEDLGAANLIDKIAGQDDSTDHMDWDGDDPGSSGPAFVGWTGTDGLVVPTDGTVATPLGLLDTVLHTFETQVRACIVDVASCPTDPDGGALPLYVTENGLHLAELAEKLLLGFVNFSQVTDDYLDDADGPEKGLNVDNTLPRSDGAPDTALEHHWDEGWGYFGAAIDFGDYTDEEIAGSGGRPEYQRYHDFDADGCIDVGSEYNFGTARYAGLRDRDSVSPTDFTTDAFQAFLTGRWLISQGAALTEIKAQRDIAVEAFDRVIAANTIHYINDTLEDLSECGTPAFSFESLAAHFSEMKSFALALQLNPRSTVHEASFDYAAFHTALGDAPVLCGGDVSGYTTALVDARADLATAYGFAMADVEAW